MSTSLERTILALTLLCAGGGSIVLAQEPGPDSLSRTMGCDQAAAVLDAPDARGERYYRAVSELPSCPSAGVRSLGAQWKRPPRDTTALRLLGEVTPRLRDRQLFETVLGVFRGASHPRDVRLAALEALAGYYEPGLAIRFTEPTHPVQHGSAYVMLGRGDPPHTETGPTPLTQSARREILQALQEVGRQDPDERLRLVADYLHSRLAQTP